MVQTANGEVAAADLGFTLMHEHIFSLSPGLLTNWPHAFNREAEMAYAAGKFAQAYADGVRTLVDLTTIDLGRDMGLIAEIAQRTRVQIVVATGVHLKPPGFVNRRVPDRITELFVRDIEQGIGESGIRAGVIKIASGTVVDEQNIVHLRAAGRAHLATGVPISTHSEVSTGTGATQQEIFAEEGVDLTKVVIGHSGDSTDLDYLGRILDRGSSLGMDRFGTGMGASTEERVATIAELCRRGYAGQMVLSHDTSCFSDTFPREIRESRLPDWEYTMIPMKVLPALHAAGVSHSDVLAMTTGNPRRLFGG